MRLLLVGLIAVSLTACDLKEAFTGSVRSVARAGELELPRDTLAAILSAGRWPLRRDVVEQLAFRWVEYALMAQRLAAGDSLLDSATVFHTFWPEATQWLVDDFRDSIIAEQLAVDSAVVDSAYQAGYHRLLYHILIRTRPDMTPPQKQEAFVRAGRIRAQVVAGGSWERANEQNEDPTPKSRGGSLGVVEPGEMVQPFEQAAWALIPGELSNVVETQYGYHIIWRPRLEEVWDEYEEEIRDILELRTEDAFLADLVERWNVRVRSDGPATMRAAATAPLQTFVSSKVVGTYRGGEFRTDQFVRWLQVLPDPVHQSVISASDEQLAELARTLMRNEVLVREAMASGIEYMDEDLPYLQGKVREEIGKLLERIPLASALEGQETPEARLAAAERAVLDYYHILTTDLRQTVIVPAFLADKLRLDMEWSVSQTGIDQVLERALALREQQQLGGAGSSPATRPTANDESPQ